MSIMSQDKKITDEQLVKELKKGKSQKEIAYEYGYGYPSRTLSARISDLGFEKRQKASVGEQGISIYIRDEDLPDQFKGSEPLYFEARRTGSKKIVVKLAEEKWMRQPDNSTTTGEFDE